MISKKAVSSNNLVILIIIAVAVSVAGTLISLNKLYTLDITGFGSAEGHINVSAATSTALSLKVGEVNFTTMAAGGLNTTTDNNPAPFLLSNDGNVCLNISIQRDQTNWFSGTMVGGAGATDNHNNNTQMQINCTGSGRCNTESNSSWTNISADGAVTIIVAFNYTGTGANDSAELDIRIEVPSDEVAGHKNTTLTFTSVDAGGC